MISLPPFSRSGKKWGKQDQSHPGESWSQKGSGHSRHLRVLLGECSHSVLLASLWCGSGDIIIPFHIWERLISEGWSSLSKLRTRKWPSWKLQLQAYALPAMSQGHCSGGGPGKYACIPVSLLPPFASPEQILPTSRSISRRCMDKCFKRRLANMAQ